MTPMRKRLYAAIVLVGGALIAQQVLSLVADHGDEVEPVPASSRDDRRKTPARRDAPTTAAGLQLDRLAERDRALAQPEPERQAEPFAVVSWQLPAPPPPSPPAPPPPRARPFPYAYLGLLVEDGERTVFFYKAERVLAVKAGDTVDGAFRIDSITDRQMNLTYLPLGQTQVLPLGNAR